MSEYSERAGRPTGEDESDGAPTGTAAVVTAVWCELFGVPRVGPDEDFFDLGGHSMLAIRMASRLRTELGLRVPVRTIMENPTVEGLTRLLDDAVGSTWAPTADESPAVSVTDCAPDSHEPGPP